MNKTRMTSASAQNFVQMHMSSSSYNEASVRMKISSSYYTEAYNVQSWFGHSTIRVVHSVRVKIRVLMGITLTDGDKKANGSERM